MHTNDLVPNHTKLFRQLRLNADYTVSDIFSVRRSTRDNDPDYPTTYQESNIGRYNLISRKGENKIKVLDRLNNASLEADEIATFLTKVPQTLIDWLLDSESMKYSNFVPFGYGWDGKFTKSEYIKRQRAQVLFTPSYGRGSDLDSDKLNHILDEICRTPKMYLTLNWDDAKTIPKDRIIPVEYINKISGEYMIIFIDNHGSHRIQKLKKIIGAVGKHPGLSIPNTVSSVIILEFNITTDDEGHPLGCGVQLLKDNDNVVTVWEV